MTKKLQTTRDMDFVRLRTRKHSERLTRRGLACNTSSNSLSKQHGKVRVSDLCTHLHQKVGKLHSNKKSLKLVQSALRRICKFAKLARCLQRSPRLNQERSTTAHALGTSAHASADCSGASIASLSFIGGHTSRAGTGVDSWCR